MSLINSSKSLCRLIKIIALLIFELFTVQSTNTFSQKIKISQLGMSFSQQNWEFRTAKLSLGHAFTKQILPERQGCKFYRSY